MTSRERILAAIEMTGPDRAPVHHYIFPGAFLDHGDKLLDLLAKYPDDFGNVGPLANYEAAKRQGPAREQLVEHKDAWGTVWHRSSEYTTGEVKVPAIPSWDIWPDYAFPGSPRPDYFERFAADVARRHPAEFVHVGGGGLFQHIQNLRGPENFFYDLGEDRQELHELCERLVEYYLPTIRGHVKAGVDCVAWGDDWGTQTAMLCHPDTWRRIFKPHYQRMFDAVKEGGAKVWTHSDGWILEILPDLVEMGVDVINPQHPCMGTRRVGELVGGKACIRTDIDRQTVIPFGTPDEVRAAVREVMEVFGSFNGGVLLHGEIGPGVPWENIEALYTAFYEYGRYQA